MLAIFLNILRALNSKWKLDWWKNVLRSRSWIDERIFP